MVEGAVGGGVVLAKMMHSALDGLDRTEGGIAKEAMVEM